MQFVLPQHILMRELLSSTDKRIEVNGTIYNEKDILQILDKNQQQKATYFDIHTFWETFPNVKVVSEKGAIDSYYKGDLNTFLNYEFLAQAQDFHSQYYSTDLEIEINEHIRSFEFFPAAKKTSYLFVFTQETQARIKQNLRNLITEILQESDTHFEFITWEPYYELLQVIADGNQEFLEKQYEISFQQLGGFSYDQWSTFFKRQQLLAFDAPFQNRIVQDEHQYFQANKALVTHRSQKTYVGYTSDRDDIQWKVILGIGVLLINFLFALMKCNKSSEYDKNISQDPALRELMERSISNDKRNQPHSKEEVDSIRAVFQRVREIGESK